MEKIISSRQLSIIAFLSVLSLKLTVLPALIYSKIGVDAVLLILFITAIDFLEFFFIYYVLKNNQNISFYDFLSNKTGKFFTKIIFILIFIFYLFKMLLLCSGGFNYASSAIFKEAPLYLFLFILLVSSSSLFLFGIKSYSRTVEFFYPLIASMFIIFLFMAIFTAPLQDVRPFFQSESSSFFASFFNFGILGGNYIFMLFFMGKIKFTIKTKSILLKNILFGWALLIIFYVINYSIFKNTAAAHPHAISEIIQYLPLPNILGNFDWFAVSFMLILFVFHGGLFIFCMTYSLNNIIKTNRIKNLQKASQINLLIINILIVLLLYLIFPTFLSLKEFLFDKMVISIISYSVLLIPLLSCFLQFISNIKKNTIKNR